MYNTHYMIVSVLTTVSQISCVCLCEPLSMMCLLVVYCMHPELRSQRSLSDVSVLCFCVQMYLKMFKTVFVKITWLRRHNDV